ncbi:O-antigen ligase family protein [Salinivibrio costicola]|uniref:O-antigen ligase family protein n=1 Tax=Salinivibrio costicola TaxID=51367 RepID=A0ABX6K294_SALCS|nr:O-antigen ligase family protein [Salinivibrio costicola]QIR05049.1 O-antigen ligase family protein [Salinivibrio costicola]
MNQVTAPSLFNLFEDKRYYHLARFFLFGYALTAIAFPDAGELFRALFLALSVPLLVTHRHFLKKDVFFWIFVGIMAIQGLSWLSSTIHIPQLANDYPHFDRLAKLFIFIPIGLILQGNNKASITTLVLFAIGIFIACLTQSDFRHQLELAFQLRRVDFGLKNAQFTSMLAGSTALVFFGLFFAVKHATTSFKVKSILSLLLMTALAFSVLLAIVSQSRQVWLAMVTVMFMLPLILMLSGVIKSKKSVFISYSIVVLIFLSISQLDYIQQRALKEQSVLAKIVSGDLDNIPMTSIGIRINSWLDASKSIAEHPILGLGENGIKHVINSSDKLMALKNSTSGSLKDLAHLHSNHIELLVAYGIIGFSLVLALYILPCIKAYKGYQAGMTPQWTLILALCFYLFWFIINGFETFNSRSYGVFSFVVISGVVYGLTQVKRLKRDND